MIEEVKTRLLKFGLDEASIYDVGYMILDFREFQILLKF
jgi:hypothetical protein